jgi:hypothetical protein
VASFIVLAGHRAETGLAMGGRRGAQRRDARVVRGQSMLPLAALEP